MNNDKSERVPDWAISPMAQLFKDLLTRVGAFLPKILIQCLDSSLHYLEGGRWMRAHGFKNFKRVQSRNEIFQFVATTVNSKKFLYLEFGVHEGATILHLSKLIPDASAIFHGFDSFIGLPERWNAANKRGHFSTEGKIPQTSDSRISFFKGWFNEALKTYSIPTHDQLFINIDCDLYSSTATVLEALKSSIKPGTYIYFDEFYDRNHEMKAFEEFIEATNFRFKCLLSTQGLGSVLFQRTD